MGEKVLVPAISPVGFLLSIMTGGLLGVLFCVGNVFITDKRIEQFFTHTTLPLMTQPKMRSALYAYLRDNAMKAIQLMSKRLHVLMQQWRVIVMGLVLAIIDGLVLRKIRLQRAGPDNSILHRRYLRLLDAGLVVSACLGVIGSGMAGWFFLLPLLALHGACRTLPKYGVGL